MFSKETNLTIIQGVKSFGYQNCTIARYWRQLHAKIRHLEELKNMGWKGLKTYYCTKLIFDIKDNKFDLPSKEVCYLCYPLLKNLLHLNFTLTNSKEYPKVIDKRLKGHKIILNYLLTRGIFNNEIWEQMHELSRTSPEKSFVININNPQYELTFKEKSILSEYINTSKTNKVKNVKRNAVNYKSEWLEKKPQPPVNNHSKNDQCVISNPDDNEKEKLDEQLELVEISDDSEFEFTIPWSFYDSADSDEVSGSE